MARTRKPQGKPRLREAERTQLELREYSLDSLLSEDHRARVLWEMVGRLDLSAFYDAIEAREHTPGHPATDPKILLTLWLYATAEGVGSARQLERLCTRDNAYRWICGGVSTNHHTLADFRVAHGDKLDALLTNLLAVLMKEGLLELHRVAQDGVRVRASAGAGSFRRRETLEQCQEQAKEQVETLRKELDQDPSASSDREKAARQRAARERLEAIERALEEMPEVEETKARNKKKSPGKKTSEARVSTTDSEARVMKMGDGGWRPAYNIQFGTDVDTRFILGVAVTNVGSDAEQMLPMVEQVEQRTGYCPNQWLTDGGFINLEQIDQLEAWGIKVYMPPATPRIPAIDPYKPKPNDTEHVARWRRRMGTKNAKEIYKLRAATAETVNADLRRWRGLQLLPVRGSPKVRCIALLMALTHNLLRWCSPQLAAA
jgi:transposase